MDVNFEYYKVFYYVAKYKNFTKAAHALGSGQPNVTRAMNCLEQQTHCTLFIRTNRGVQLTPEGEMLFTHVEAAISQIQTAETAQWFGAWKYFNRSQRNRIEYLPAGYIEALSHEASRYSLENI